MPCFLNCFVFYLFQQFLNFSQILLDQKMDELVCSPLHNICLRMCAGF